MRVRKHTAFVPNPTFHFPEDAITEILLKLPIKYIIRFTLVCKKWQSLIESPHFIRKHFEQNPNPNCSKTLIVACYNDETDGRTLSMRSMDALDTPIDLDFPYLYYLRIIGVCNGLVCLTISEGEPNLVICNPATRRFTKIQNCEFWDTDLFRAKDGEAVLGFGYDPYSNDYKLVKVTRYSVGHIEYIEQAWLYTLSDNSWREISIPTPINNDAWFRHVYASTVINNSVFYWDMNKYPSYSTVILSFDMSDESFKVIPGPESQDGIKWTEVDWKSCQVNEQLAILVSHNMGCFSMWTLSADLDCWNLKFSVRPVLPGRVEEKSDVEFVGCGENNDVVCMYHTYGDNGEVKLFSYDLRSGEIKWLAFGEIGCDYQVNGGYKESLFLVKKYD